MPYTISQNDDGEYCVYRADDEGEPTGETLGCHPTQDEAAAQIGAIEAEEGKAVVRKLYTGGAVKALDDLTFEAVITTGALDRDGQIVLPTGVDVSGYMRNPVVMYAHDYTQLPVARALGIRPEGDALVAKFQFPAEGTYDFADTVRRMWGAGFLNATSIGFVPKQWSEDRMRIEQAELLEFSIVPVPANQEALRRALDVVNTKPAIKEGRVLSGKDIEMMDAIISDLTGAAKRLRQYVDAHRPQTESAQAAETVVVRPDIAATATITSPPVFESLDDETLDMLRELNEKLKEYQNG